MAKSQDIPDDVRIFMEIDGEAGPFIAVDVPAAEAEAEAIALEASGDMTKNLLSRNPLRRRRAGPDLDKITDDAFNNPDHWMRSDHDPSEDELEDDTPRWAFCRIDPSTWTIGSRR